MNIFAQTVVDLSNVTSNVQLGSNCSPNGTIQDYIAYGDVNLNGKKIKLKNATLSITGNLTNGRVQVCGNQNASFCVQGSISNVEYNNSDLNCSTLSNIDFEVKETKWYVKNGTFHTDADSIEIYDILGKMVLKSNNEQTDISYIKRGIYIIRMTKGNGTKVIKTQF